jgi:hypothetical protein
MKKEIYKPKIHSTWDVMNLKLEEYYYSELGFEIIEDDVSNMTPTAGPSPPPPPGNSPGGPGPGGPGPGGPPPPGNSPGGPGPGGPPPPGNYWQPGDVNQDGSVNVIDLSMMIGHILNLNQLNTLQQQLADINNNGQVSIVDVVQAIELMLGTTPQQTSAVNNTLRKYSTRRPGFRNTMGSMRGTGRKVRYGGSRHQTPTRRNVTGRRNSVPRGRRRS